MGKRILTKEYCIIGAGPGNEPLASQKSEKQSPAPRVDPNSNIPIRRQIFWAKAKKAAEKPVEVKRKQSFRRTALTPAQRQAQLQRMRLDEEAARRYKGKNSQLKKMAGTAENERPPWVLVDGYNLLFHDKRIQQQVQSQELELEVARRHLNDRLAEYSQVRKLKLEVVYDALLGGNGSSVHQHPGGIWVFFSGCCDADSILMYRCRELLQEAAEQPQGRRQRSRASHVCVVTNDNVASLMTFANGASRIGCGDLINDMRQADIQFLDALGNWNARANISFKRRPLGGLLAGADDSTAEVLAAAKMGVSVDEFRQRTGQAAAPPRAAAPEAKRKRKKASMPLSDAVSLWP